MYMFFLSGTHEIIEIEITDNGKGIPADVLKRLGQQGETHGKAHGHGLGLYHAKRSIESWNGKLSIESEEGKGTKVTIQLPRSETPSWFVPELKLKMNGYVIVLDDDSSIHQIWDKRFQESGMRLLHFSIPDQVLKWVERNVSNHPVATDDSEVSEVEVIYLFDYELIGHKFTGLDLIERLNIAAKSILVTSRFEELGILERCQSLGVKLIPKSMAESVPIVIDHSYAISLDNQEYDANFIDDDRLLRLSWKNSAKEKGIKLLTLGSTKEFEQFASRVPKHATFYIDRELGEEEPKGEAWAKEIFEKGYRNLYLATGYSANYFPPMEWIVGFVGKVPPWEQDCFAH